AEPAMGPPLTPGPSPGGRGKRIGGHVSQNRHGAVDVADDDGRPDIFVANDGNNRFLFLNRTSLVPGERKMKLEDKALAAGVALDDNGYYNGSMGVDVGDYDGSGRASLWVTNYQGELH